MPQYSFETTIEILGSEYEAEVYGDATKGSPATSTWNCPMGYPGDDPEGEVTSVLVDLPVGPKMLKGKYVERVVDIVDMIPDDLRKEFENKLIDLAKEDHGKNYDDHSETEERIKEAKAK